MDNNVILVVYKMGTHKFLRDKKVILVRDYGGENQQYLYPCVVRARGMGEFEAYGPDEERQYFECLRERLEEVLDDKKVGLREAEKRFLLRFIPHVEYDGCVTGDGSECPLAEHRDLADLLKELDDALPTTPDLKQQHASVLFQVQLRNLVEYPLRSFDKTRKEMCELLANQPIEGVRSDRIELYRDLVQSILGINDYCNKYRAVRLSVGRCLVEGEFAAARVLCAVLADDIRDYFRRALNIEFETDERLRSDLLRVQKEAIETVLEFAADEQLPERQLPYFNRARDIVKIDLITGFDDLSRRQAKKQLPDYSWVEGIIEDIQNGTFPKQS